MHALIQSHRQTVIEKRQEKTYKKDGNESLVVQLKQSDNKQFKFGNMDHKCISVLHIRMCVSENIVATFEAYEASIDVPFFSRTGRPMSIGAYDRV